MKTILRRIIFPFALFVSINASGFTYSPMGYESTDIYAEAEEYFRQTEQAIYAQSPFGLQSGDCPPGMEGCPGDTPGNDDCPPGMEGCPGDTPTPVSIKDDWYAFATFGLCYGIFQYRKKKKEKGNKQENISLTKM